MAITAQDVIDNVSIYIPASNSITQTQMLELAQKLIDRYGDDDSNLPKISCEFLKNLAIINGTASVISNGTVKREKLGGHEIEYFDGGASTDWDDYYDKIVNNVCPILGVVQKISFGATYNSSPEEPVIKSCYSKII